MRKAKQRIFAIVLGLAMVVSSLLSVIPAHAATDSQTTQSQGTQETSDATGQDKTGNIAIKLRGGAGTVTFTGEDNKPIKATISNDGKYTITQKDGTVVNPSENDDGVIYTYSEKAGQNVKIQAAPDDGYQISSFNLIDYSGTSKSITKNSTNITVTEGTATIDVDFAKANQISSQTQVSEKEVN